MSKIDMEDFLQEIQECCDDVSLSWSMYNLDPNTVRVLKHSLNKFALSKRNDILSLYEFAKVKGKYLMVHEMSLLDIMCKYEEYHDDLVQFIKAMLETDTKCKDINDTIKHVEDAASTDEKFRESLFTKPSDITFSESLGNLDVLLGLNGFIDKVYDTFIYLGNKDELASPRVKILIDLYSTSVVMFIKRITTELIKYIDRMVCIRDGKREQNEDNSNSKYVLI